MDIVFQLSGQIRGLDFPFILFNIYKKSISGTIEITTKECVKQIIIKNKNILLATSSADKDSLSEYLLKEKIISEDIAKEAFDLKTKKKMRYGRALVELAHLDYEQLWEAVRGHMKSIIFSIFSLDGGEYQIKTEIKEVDENITLDCDILSFIIEGMRYFFDDKLLYKRLKNLHHVYLYKSESIQNLYLKPYEIHIIDLVEKESSVKEIIRKSELLKFDTLRILFTLLVLETISNEKIEIPLRRRFDHPLRKRAYSPEQEGIIPGSSFLSFDEALAYFNIKYEMIYKILSKEIGPIALSILSKAIEDISEKLPFFLKKVSLDSYGSVKKNPILKSVWYYDVDQYIGEFVKGLEEILYAEIYAVKKHLGINYEQQILKWIN
ncbi:MAG: hypothetical protein KAT17_04680 [Candidatus Aminicenantes bacterium]|nr:hypothetical protein [Candidatus Aminicenantes bacterium]